MNSEKKNDNYDNIRKINEVNVPELPRISGKKIPPLSLPFSMALSFFLSMLPPKIRWK